MDANQHLFEVTLTLTSDNDKVLRALTDHIRRETYSGAKGWYRLGLVLRKMGHSDKAQQVYDILLEHTANNREKAVIYIQLGLTKHTRGEYAGAITCYEKALEIYKKVFFPASYNLTACYNNIGDYPKALSFDENALTIREQSFPLSHPHLSMSYNNIGLAYENMKNYSKADSFYERAVNIGQQSLPLNHSNL